MSQKQAVVIRLSSDLELKEREALKKLLRNFGILTDETERGVDVWHETIRFVQQHSELFLAGGGYAATKLADEFFAWLRAVRERRNKEAEKAKETSNAKQPERRLIEIVDPTQIGGSFDPLHASREQVRRYVG